MNLHNLYKTNEDSILDGQFILIYYDLFFNEECLGTYSRFVIDDPSEIEQLKDVLKSIRLKVPTTMVYVCAYGNELEDNQGEKFLYADSIWINGSFSREMVSDEFQNILSIEPSSIELLDAMGERNQSPIQYFTPNGEVIDLSLEHNFNYLENAIALYWD